MRLANERPATPFGQNHIIMALPATPTGFSLCILLDDLGHEVIEARIARTWGGSKTIRVRSRSVT